MWKVALRHFGHRHRNPQRQHLEKVEFQIPLKRAAGILWDCQAGRFTSSAAACSDGGGVDVADVDVRRDLAHASGLGSVALPSPAALSSLEESVTALDAALHRAVHLPWLANHLWWMQWLSETRTEFQTLSRNSISVTSKLTQGAKSFASSAAVTEILDEEGGAEIEREHLQRVDKRNFYERSDDERLGEEEDEKRYNVQGDRQSKKYRQSLYNRQRKVEISAWKSAAAEYKKLVVEMCQKNLAPNIPFVQSLLLGWFEPLKRAIEVEQGAIKNLEFKDHRAGYGPYILQLPSDKLAVITMHKVMSALMLDWTSSGTAKLVSVAVQIGEAVETEVMIQKVTKRKKKKKKQTEATASNGSADLISAGNEIPQLSQELQENVQGLVKKQRLRLAKNLLRQAEGMGPWSKDIHAKVGCALAQLFLDTAFLQSPASQHGDDAGEVRPAFLHYMKSCTGGGVARMFGVIQCDPLIAQHLDKSVQFMTMPYMPMLVKPRNWKGYKKGGHLVLPSSVMRTHGSRQQKEAIEKSSKRMRKVFDALNSLGSIPWKINGRILDVIEKIWADGGGIASMVEAGDIPLPERPMTEDEYALKRWRSDTAKVKRINNERYSLRCDIELKLKVAREMEKEDAFYYPHSLDFRGRAYPLHPHLNHLGSDMCRGVLEFAVGCPLGEAGYRWLKIHLANVFAGGVDKLSFDDRVVFADQNIENIFDSAERPVDGRRWWLQAEDPFQCLATCMNIRDATLSGDVKTFVSTLPVHQDGSCNGLQHYAALGRDQNGAEAVNLTAGDKPADVYTGIAMRVRATMEKDAADNPRVNPNAEKAKLLLSQIDRKLVKQTVMTSVYGVTYIGARSQIMSRLKERGFGDDTVTFGIACYAAKVTIDALGQMFGEARCIMTWLGDCAKIIACEGEPVKWTTPLGLPVVQPYRKAGRKLVKTTLQVLALQHFNDQPVMVSRQRSAFPPNFVHSLDGSHMMMTANACKEAGIQFAGVHDSFWTHAGTVEDMNAILRKTFVELYSRPVLEDLLANFKKRFPRLDFPSVPRRGVLELSDVLDARYFFN